MEEARCWMLSNKRKHSLSCNNNLPYDDSWEEAAFAEDSAGPLGGCIWPPRSYSCSFCRREFRSAQALGGHMNVHRRDRARLKQSPASPPNNEILHQNLFQNNFTSLGFHQYPSHQICTLVYNPNPNSDPPTTQRNCNERNPFPPFSSSSSSSTNFSIKEEREKRSPGSSPPVQPNSDPKRKEERNSRIIESECRAKVDYLKNNDLSMSLNLVVRRTCPNDQEEEEEEEAIGCKRRRITSNTTTSSLPLFMKSNSEVFEISPCSREELDLELRLGDRPKVK